MSEIKKEQIGVDGATVDFFTYRVGDVQYFEFDTSRCGPPEPMVNAMSGLKLIDSANKRLVMINHKKPMGLLNKIGENFELLEESGLSDGRVKLVFGYKAGESEKADLDDASCGG
jgi:hypothetical protein